MSASEAQTAAESKVEESKFKGRCWFFQSPNGCNKPCFFTHALDEYARPPVCVYWVRGRCNTGSKCQYLHEKSPDEPGEDVRGDYSNIPRPKGAKFIGDPKNAPNPIVDSPRPLRWRNAAAPMVKDSDGFESRARLEVSNEKTHLKSKPKLEPAEPIGKPSAFAALNLDDDRDDLFGDDE